VWPKLYSALPCSSAPPPPLKCRTTFPFVILSEAKDLLSLAPLKLLTRMTKECALHHRPQGVHPATLPVSMPRDHRYFVYILSSKSRRIYTGVTNNLFRRILQHKRGEIEGLTQHYRINRLVYYEQFQYVGNAIHREKVIKGWLREKKIALIERDNPTWDDLDEDWRNPLPKLNVLPGGRESRSFGRKRPQDDNQEITASMHR